MTRDLIAGKVAMNLEDESWLHFTLEDLYDSIHDGYEITALATQCVERVATLDVVEKQTYYNLRELFPDYYRVFAMYNLTINQWVTPHAIKEFQNYGYNWELHHGNILEWAPLGCDWLAVYKKPLVTIPEGLLIYYKAFPEPLQGNESPEFGAESHSALVEYATGDLLDQNLEYTKSQQWMNKHVERLARIKIDLNSRSMPDRIYALTCQYMQMKG